MILNVSDPQRDFGLRKGTSFNKITRKITPFVCALCQDSKWVEEKQLFLRRNQELFEKVRLSLLLSNQHQFSACLVLTV